MTSSIGPEDISRLTPQEKTEPLEHDFLPAGTKMPASLDSREVPSSPPLSAIEIKAVAVAGEQLKTAMPPKS